MPPKYKPLTTQPPAKKPMPPMVVQWANEPAKHDYPSAGNYLSLLADEKLTNDLVDRLEKAPTIFHRANDILRAAQLPLLDIGDFRVQADLRKIVDGVILSPVLIIRGDILKGYPTTIADGYHRVCASYHLSEGTYIPCRIAELPVEEKPHHA